MPPDPLLPDAPRRPARTWALLLCVWTVGLVVWVAYLFAIGSVLIRVLFGGNPEQGASAP
jgi:hypothetical protein